MVGPNTEEEERAKKEKAQRQDRHQLQRAGKKVCPACSRVFLRYYAATDIKDKRQDPLPWLPSRLDCEPSLEQLALDLGRALTDAKSWRLVPRQAAFVPGSKWNAVRKNQHRPRRYHREFSLRGGRPLAHANEPGNRACRYN